MREASIWFGAGVARGFVRAAAPWRRAGLGWAELSLFVRGEMRLAGWPQTVAGEQLEYRSWPAAELGDLLCLAACTRCCWSGIQGRSSAASPVRLLALWKCPERAILSEGMHVNSC